MTTNPNTNPNVNQGTFFSGTSSLRSLLRNNEPLFLIEEHIDFEPLVKIASDIWRKNSETKSNRGRQPWPVELMFRVILLKHLFNMADETLEREIRYNISYKAFVGLELLDTVPDRRTIWFYNEELAQNNAGRKLFDAFKVQLQTSGLIVKEGKIVDATFTLVPVQRNTREILTLYSQKRKSIVAVRQTHHLLMVNEEKQ